METCTDDNSQETPAISLAFRLWQAITAKKLLLPLLAVMLLLPWPVAYAYDDSADGVGTISVEAAPAENAPAWTTYGRAIGGIDRPGDLFLVDMAGRAADAQATLHITNADELTNAYRYLTLRVGLYVREDNSWKPLATITSEGYQESYITLQNGYLDLDLPGHGSYKITIDGGCFYSHDINTGSAVSPKFYLSVQ